MRDALAHRVQRLGLHHGKPPFGYRRLSPREPLEIEPNEAPIVLSIFRAYAAGDSLGAIARRLTAAGIPTAQGRPVWHISELRVILRNRAYRGEVPHRGNYYPGHHPALVPARLWQQAQDRLASARRLGAPRTPRSLGVLLRCAICGAPMRRGQFHETRRPAPRYDCREREHFTGDQRHPPNSVGADKAEAAIWLYTEWLLERGGFREGLELYLTRLAKERASGEAARARERLRQIDAQLSRALRGYSLGNLPEDIYLREIEPLQAERTHLQAQLDAVQVPPDLRELAGYLRHLQPATYIRNLRRQPVHVQAAFLGRLFERIDVRGNLLTFYHRAVPLPPWEMTLPRRWSSKQDSGAFTLPDGTVTTGRPPRH